MDQISPLFALINVLPRVLKKLLDLFLNLVLLPRIEFSFETKRDLVKKKNVSRIVFCFASLPDLGNNDSP